MTFGPSILGDSAPSAPPPGSPPPALPGGTITQEERLFAIVAYLGYFTGFWLVAPLVIYVLKRDSSRFVAHHALRAVILHVLAIPIFVACGVLYLLIAVGAAALLEGSGHRSGDLVGALLMIATILSWVVPWFLYLGICVLAAVNAARQKVETKSWLGRTVERWLGPAATRSGLGAEP